MKLIYSYIPHRYKPNNALDFHTALIFYYSVLQAKKFYKDITLYTNKEVRNQIYDLEIPVSRINTTVLENEGASCPSIPKLKTYAAQVEPFIHIDLDTILYSKVLPNPNIPVSFAHLDFEPNLFSEPWKKISSIQKAYINPFIENILPPSYSNIPLTSIPNMNIVCCTNPEEFKNNVWKALELYWDNEKWFNEEYYRFCTIEQLAIHAELFNNNKDYKKAVSQSEHTFSKKDPVSFELEDKSPKAYISNFFGKRTIVGKDKNDLIEKMLKENFGGYLHLCGNLKGEKIIHEFLVKRILEDFGEGPLINLQNYFGDSFTIDKDIWSKLI